MHGSYETKNSQIGTPYQTFWRGTASGAEGASAFVCGDSKNFGRDDDLKARANTVSVPMRSDSAAVMAKFQAPHGKASAA